MDQQASNNQELQMEQLKWQGRGEPRKAWGNMEIRAYVEIKETQKLRENVLKIS